jgi:hypothetical protein
MATGNVSVLAQLWVCVLKYTIWIFLKHITSFKVRHNYQYIKLSVNKNINIQYNAVKPQINKPKISIKAKTKNLYEFDLNSVLLYICIYTFYFFIKARLYLSVEALCVMYGMETLKLRRKCSVLPQPRQYCQG